MGDVRITVAGAGGAAARFGRIRSRLSEVERTAPGEVAQATAPAFEAVAPVKTGRLRSRIHAEGAELIVDPVADDGFHYAPVTRFGRGPIVAHNAKALRFEIGGKIIFRRSVGPYKPAEDWAERAHGEADRLAEQRWQRIIRGLLG